VISKAYALAVLASHLAKEFPQYGPGGIVINDDAIERGYGWIFTYTTTEFRRTKDFRHILIGAGPVLVLRDNGKIVEFSSAFSKEYALAEYEAHPATYHVRK
jgi:hypothetical protein